MRVAMTEQEIKETKMFGMTVEDINDIIEEQFNYSGGTKMFAMSLLSDAQHALEYFDNKETARQLINVAKMVMSKNWEVLI